MRWSCRQAVLISLLLYHPALHAQHAATGGTPHGPPSLVIQPRNFAAPPKLPTPSRVPQVGRTGHWPSWSTDDRPGKPVQHHPYVYPGYLSFGYGLPLGYGLVGGDDQATSSAPPPPGPVDEFGPAGPDPQMAENAPSYRPAYVGPSDAAAMEPSAHAQPATTLIFRDGRPPKQVHNYALIGANLWALDGDSRQEIPLASLDIPATVKANREAGVDFALPNGR